MTSHILTLKIPDPLYRKLKDRAEKSHRSLEDETVEALTATVPVVDELPADLQEAISSLTLLDDDALWKTARGRLDPESSRQLEKLHAKRGQEQLTQAETQALEQLVRLYEKTLLVKAQSAVLLKQRGHDVSGLLEGI